MAVHMQKIGRFIFILFSIMWYRLLQKYTILFLQVNFTMRDTPFTPVSFSIALSRERLLDMGFITDTSRRISESAPDDPAGAEEHGTASKPSQMRYRMRRSTLPGIATGS